IGRQKELLQWEDGSFIDPQHVSKLLVRSVFVKDAMVARRQPDDPFLSVFIFPDYKRLEMATGLTATAALKRRCVDAIEFAESIARITPALNKWDIYILPRKLERT